MVTYIWIRHELYGGYDTERELTLPWLICSKYYSAILSDLLIPLETENGTARRVRHRK